MRGSCCGLSFVLSLFSIAGCSANAGGTDTATSGGDSGTAGTASGGSTVINGGSSSQSVGGNTNAGGGGGTSTSTGGAATGGTSPAAGGSGGTQELPHTVSDCGSLPEPGTWEEITPPDVVLDDGEYGTNMFVMNPQDYSIVTLGTSKHGVWRTTDCGASWTKQNTGESASEIDSGRQWSMVIDPVEPDTIYTVAGYGANGVWKTTNGGVDWKQIMSADAMAAFQYGGFTHQVKMDPTDHLHLTANPHFACEGAHAGSCFAETTDGGDTWTVVDGAPPSGEGAGRAMLSYDVWLWSQGFDGLYRTTNRGQDWDLVGGQDGYSRDSFSRAPDGTIYNPAAFNINASTDDGASWHTVENSPSTEVLTVTSKRIWATNGACVAEADNPLNPVHYAPVDDPTNWTHIDDGPGISWGPDHLEYDSDHGLLYVSACRSGMWRLRIDE